MEILLLPSNINKTQTLQENKTSLDFLIVINNSPGGRLTDLLNSREINRKEGINLPEQNHLKTSSSRNK